MDVVRDQKKYPSLAKDKMKRLQPCRASVQAGWRARRYIAAEDKAVITVDQARDRLSALTRRESVPPSIDLEKRTVATAALRRATKKTVPGRELWPVPDDLVRSIRERDAKAAAAVDWQMYASYGLMVGSLGMLVLGLVVHKKNTEKRTSRLFYELTGTEAEDYNLVRQALSHLAQSQRIWRIEGEAATSDWKRNAGASSLVRRKSASVTSEAPPRVKTNVSTPCLHLGGMRFFFMPDVILCCSTAFSDRCRTEVSR